MLMDVIDYRYFKRYFVALETIKKDLLDADKKRKIRERHVVQEIATVLGAMLLRDG